MEMSSIREGGVMPLFRPFGEKPIHVEYASVRPGQDCDMKSIRSLLQQAAVLAQLCASLTTFASTAFAQGGMFVPTGGMSSARSNHTATLLSNGKVLIAGGYNCCTATTLASAELYDPAAGTFTPTGSMNIGRNNHTATLLNNGKVLVAGGSDNNGLIQAGAELYDPATGTFTATGSMSTVRSNHTATLLNNGKVLVAGGITLAGTLASTELYDPATGTFTATGSMSTFRSNHTATLLNNGKVLIAGGENCCNFGVLTSEELYDSSTGTFSSTGSLQPFTNSSRILHTATLLNNGKVLVAGGAGGHFPAAPLLVQSYTTPRREPLPSPAT